MSAKISNVELFDEQIEIIPAHLNNSLIKLSAAVNSHDLSKALFFSIAYLVCECGFTPDCPAFKKFDKFNFDYSSLKCFESAPIDDIIKSDPLSIMETYKCPLRIGEIRSITLIGYVNTCNGSKFLTVNLHMEKPHYLATQNFKVGNFIDEVDGKIRFKMKKELSLRVKNGLAIPAKQDVMFHNSIQHVPHISAMPDHVLRKIQTYLFRVWQRSFEEAIGLSESPIRGQDRIPVTNRFKWI